MPNYKPRGFKAGGGSVPSIRGSGKRYKKSGKKRKPKYKPNGFPERTDDIPQFSISGGPDANMTDLDIRSRHIDEKVAWDKANPDLRYYNPNGSKKTPADVQIGFEEDSKKRKAVQNRNKMKKFFQLSYDLSKLKPNEKGFINVTDSMAKMVDLVPGITGIRDSRNENGELIKGPSEFYARVYKPEGEKPSVAFFQKGEKGGLLPMMNKGRPIEMKLDVLKANAPLGQRLYEEELNQTMGFDKQRQGLSKAEEKNKTNVRGYLNDAQKAFTQAKAAHYEDPSPETKLMLRDAETNVLRLQQEFSASDNKVNEQIRFKKLPEINVNEPLQDETKGFTSEQNKGIDQNLLVKPSEEKESTVVNKNSNASTPVDETEEGYENAYESGPNEYRFENTGGGNVGFSREISDPDMKTKKRKGGNNTGGN